MICHRTSASIIAAVAVVALAGTPAWGQGLGIRSIGYHGASQKCSSCAVGHKGIAQKGVMQKGVMQKGIVQKGGGCCGLAQKGGCGGCNQCCLNVIPALINGVGCLLDGIFSCNRCCTSGMKGGGKSCMSCGGKGYGGEMYLAPSANSPFVDDLTPPPVPMTEARVTRRAPIYAASARSRSVRRAAPIPASKKLNKVAQASHVRQPAVVRANNIEETVDDIPANPLRK